MKPSGASPSSPGLEVTASVVAVVSAGSAFILDGCFYPTRILASALLSFLTNIDNTRWHRRGSWRHQGGVFIVAEGDGSRKLLPGSYIKSWETTAATLPAKSSKTPPTGRYVGMASADARALVTLDAGCDPHITSPVIDGNKRTGFMVTVVFLELSGLEFNASEELNFLIIDP